jgi:hypothetical protein
MKISAKKRSADKTQMLDRTLAAKARACRLAVWISMMLAFACCWPLRIQAQTTEQEIRNPGAEAGKPDKNPPQTREELLRQKREEKTENLVTPQQGIVENFAKSFDRKGSNSIEDINFWGFHPRLEWIARGSGAALGVRYWKPETLGPVDLMGAAFYSWRRYQHYDLQMGVIPNRGKRIPPRSFETEEVEQLGDIEREAFSRFKLYANGRFRDRTDESFYGTGPDSLEENRARYRIKDTLIEAVTGYQLTRRIGFTFKAGLLHHTLRPGRSTPPLEPLFDELDLPGNSNPPNYVRYHTSVLFDYRDTPGLPHQGAMIAFGWEKFDNVNTKNQFNFNRFGLDARGYIPLGAHQRVIALRAVAINSDPASSNRVPFVLQPSLGGGESLRGYDAFRFQGDKMLLLQGEYRREASRRFELAFFGDTGTVADQGSRLSINKMKSDAGIGFRFKSSRTTLFRLDIARSNEGVHFQVRVSPAF